MSPMVIVCKYPAIIMTSMFAAMIRMLSMTEVEVSMM